jgi:hypothetical protein
VEGFISHCSHVTKRDKSEGLKLKKKIIVTRVLRIVNQRIRDSHVPTSKTKVHKTHVYEQIYLKNVSEANEKNVPILSDVPEGIKMRKMLS